MYHGLSRKKLIVRDTKTMSIIKYYGMDTNTQIALNKYLKFKGFETKWVSDKDNYKFAYNLNIHHEDRESGLDLNPKTFREIATDLTLAFIDNMDLEPKQFVLSLHTNTDEDGYKQTFLYYNPESNGQTIMKEWGRGRGQGQQTGVAQFDSD